MPEQPVDHLQWSSWEGQENHDEFELCHPSGQSLCEILSGNHLGCCSFCLCYIGQWACDGNLLCGICEVEVHQSNPKSGNQYANAHQLTGWVGSNLRLKCSSRHEPLVNHW